MALLSLHSLCSQVALEVVPSAVIFICIMLLDATFIHFLITCAHSSRPDMYVYSYFFFLLGSQDRNLHPPRVDVTMSQQSLRLSGSLLSLVSPSELCLCSQDQSRNAQRSYRMNHFQFLMQSRWVYGVFLLPN